MRWGLVLVTVAGCGFSVNGGAATIDANPVDADADASPGSDALPIDSELPLDGSRTDWWNANYLHRRKLTIATNRLGGTVTSFPVLVSLPTAVGVALTTDAADLRFVSDDNMNVFPHELDTFNAAATTTAWVKMDLSNNAATTTLWVYYGYPNAISASSGADVFGAFESAHHLTTLQDSSGHNHTLDAPGGATPGPQTGAIGGARSFDGNDDYLELANSGNMDFTTTMSVSAWITVNTFSTTYQCVICKGDFAWRVARADTGNGIGFGTTSGGTSMYDNLNGDTNVNNAQWHHVVAVMNGTKKQLYIDGALDTDENYNKQLDNTQTAVRLGMNVEATTGGTRNWFGLIDEVRVRATAVDATWAAAEYRTVTDPTFVTVGADEPY